MRPISSRPPALAPLVGLSQAHAQQLTPAENVQRQVAVVIVEAVKEASLLMAMQGRIGDVQIDNDLGRVLSVRLPKQVGSSLIRRSSCRSSNAPPSLAGVPSRKSASTEREKVTCKLELGLDTLFYVKVFSC